MMILHHYPMSPFSEKIRLMAGYCGLTWMSVMAPESPPRAIVDPLAGGYRRIPVAQVGADVFCDSRLICAELAQMANQPQLSPNAADASSQALADRFESEIFWAAVSSIPARRILGKLFSNLSVIQAVKFIIDRAGIARHAHDKPVPPKLAAPMFKEHLGSLEELLSGQQHHLAGDTPTHLDFAAYHTLWFQLEVGELPMPPGLPLTAAWYERLSAFGHGEVREATALDAFSAARDNEPRAIPAGMSADSKIGTEVTVLPNDYALDGTSGKLVAADDHRWIVARSAKDLGLIHVHFPRAGFHLG